MNLKDKYKDVLNKNTFTIQYYLYNNDTILYQKRHFLQQYEKQFIKEIFENA